MRKFARLTLGCVLVFPVTAQRGGGMRGGLGNVRGGLGRQNLCNPEKLLGLTSRARSGVKLAEAQARFPAKMAERLLADISTCALPVTQRKCRATTRRHWCGSSSVRNIDDLAGVKRRDRMLESAT
jgi:hypothetical protein